jgi:hypothetical protein
MKLLLFMLCSGLASCVTTPRLHPTVIHTTPQTAYVIDVLLLQDDGTQVSLALPHR